MLSRCHTRHWLARVGWPDDDIGALGSEALLTEAALNCHVLGWVTAMTNYLIWAGAIRKWRAERGRDALLTTPLSATPTSATIPGYGSTICERIVVLNKHDLVSEWGVEVRPVAFANLSLRLI